MSKELPYYQFEVAEYLAGDIMICSLEAQGLYSIIKCLYWQKECKLSVKQILKRYNNQDLINELIEEGCLKVDNGNIIISFLLIQYQAFKERREKLSAAGKKGGLHKKEATLKPPLSDDKATPKHIEENRVEENRVDKTIIYNIKQTILNSTIWIEQICMKKRIDFNICVTYLSGFLDNLELQGEIDKGEDEIKKHFINWLNLELKKEKSSDKKENKTTWTTNR